MSADTSPGSAPVVAIIPAKDREDRIAATVTALLPHVDRVVVVDDGSTDRTSQLAAKAGAHDVVRLDRNIGKGGAVTAGVEQAPDAGIYLLVDADLAETASATATLLGPLRDGSLDLAIGVPKTPSGSRGGFGKVREFSRRGIRRAVRFDTDAPLSGQRAVDGPLLRRLTESPGLADRFGLETALTIDAVRAGARVGEVPIDFEHRHTGRSLAGFRHRAAQGRDILRALWPRLTTSRQRCALMIVFASLVVAFGAVSGPLLTPSSEPGASSAAKVVVFSMTRVSLDDLDTGSVPTLDRLRREGALAASSVRTRSGRPSTVEGYATLGAGDRIRARDPAADAFAPDDTVGVGTAAEAAELRTGKRPSGEVVVVGAAQTERLNERLLIESKPGALGDALRAAGKRTAVVNNSDIGLLTEDPFASRQRPAAVAVMDSTGSVDLGTVQPDLLRKDPTKPFGATVDADAFLAAARRAIAGADVIVLDPGELDRVAAFRAETSDEQYEALRTAALGRTDALLAAIVDGLPARTLLIVTGIRPPEADWELIPTVLWGEGVRRGYAHSTSTKRLGLITITDLAPTILDALAVETPSTMIGHPLRMRPGSTSVERLQSMNHLAEYRERLYLPLTKGYVFFQAVVYLLTIFLFSSRGGVGRAGSALKWIVLAIAGLPLATFVFRMVPHVWSIGPFGIPAIVAIDFALVAVAVRYGKRHPLSPLSWLLFANTALITIDLLTGARLQQSSVLGYSPHTAARFTGIGNAAFAALAATTVLWAAIHVAYAKRRKEAWLAAACVCAVVLFVDGAPVLGSDVGGILTLVPVFGLLLYALSGRRLSIKALAIAGASTLGVLALATGVDLLRPPESRSHLGRFVTSSGDDDSTFSTTIGRKLTTNMRVLSGSFWRWVVPIIVIVLLYFLVVQRGWERDMPPRSPLRVGVVAALIAGMLGFAVNDSGTVVAAIVFVYLGPYITLLTLARQRTTVLDPHDRSGDTRACSPSPLRW